jgi:hypothetical protein
MKYDKSLDVENTEFWEDMYNNLFELIITKSAFEIRYRFTKNMQNGEIARMRCEDAMLYFAEKEEFCKAYLMQQVAKEIKDYEHIDFRE